MQPILEVFQHVDRVFLIHTTCLNEVCHLLTLSNLKEVSHVVSSVFRGFKHIHELLVGLITRGNDEIAALRNRKPETIFVTKEIEKKQVMPLAELYLDNFQKKKQPETAGTPTPKPQGLNFTSDEEYQEINKDRQRFVQKEVARLMKMVDQGKEILEPIEPDVILAFCSETIKTMTRDSQRAVFDCEELIDRLETYKTTQSLESTKKIARVVELITENVYKLNIDKLTPVRFEEYILKDRIQSVERELLSTFDKTQRDVAIRVLRVMNNYFKPVLKSKTTSTTLTSKDIDKSAAKVAAEKSSPKPKLAIEERELMKREVDAANRKVQALEAVSKELMETVVQKDSEIFYLGKKYEREKVTDEQILLRQRTNSILEEKLTKAINQGPSSFGKADPTKHKLKWLLDKVFTSVAGFMKSVNTGTSTNSAMQNLKSALQDAATGVLSTSDAAVIQEIEEMISAAFDRETSGGIQLSPGSKRSMSKNKGESPIISPLAGDNRRILPLKRMQTDSKGGDSPHRGLRGSKPSQSPSLRPQNLQLHGVAETLTGGQGRDEGGSANRNHTPHAKHLETDSSDVSRSKRTAVGGNAASGAEMDEDVALVAEMLGQAKGRWPLLAKDVRVLVQRVVSMGAIAVEKAVRIGDHRIELLEKSAASSQKSRLEGTIHNNMQQASRRSSTNKIRGNANQDPQSNLPNRNSSTWKPAAAQRTNLQSQNEPQIGQNLLDSARSDVDDSALGLSHQGSKYYASSNYLKPWTAGKRSQVPNPDATISTAQPTPGETRPLSRQTSNRKELQPLGLASFDDLPKDPTERTTNTARFGMTQPTIRKGLPASQNIATQRSKGKWSSQDTGAGMSVSMDASGATNTFSKRLEAGVQLFEHYKQHKIVKQSELPEGGSQPWEQDRFTPVPMPEPLNPFYHVDPQGKIDEDFTSEIFKMANTTKVTGAIGKHKNFDPMLHNDWSLMHLPSPHFQADGTQVEKRYKQFRNELVTFVTSHSRCGPNCPHLLRFYERVGFFRGMEHWAKRNLTAKPLPTLEIGRDPATSLEIGKRSKAEQLRKWTVHYNSKPSSVPQMLT